jgi:RimJ/RimL family protein N-acetyltransferase
MEPVTLVDPPLVLRPPAESDVEGLTQAIQDHEIARWIDAIPWPYTDSDSRFFITQLSRSGWESGDHVNWLITVDDAILGVVGLHRRYPEVQEVGYWLTPAARGRGLATQAVRRVCRFAFEELDAQRVEWQAVVGNEASRRVAERVGFRFEGVLRSRLGRPGSPADAWMAGLLRSDERAK